MKLRVLLFLFISALGLVSCSFNRVPRTSTEEKILGNTINVVDQRGREIVIQKPVDKLVAVPMPLGSLIYTIDGSSDRIAAMHPAAVGAVKAGILGKIDSKLASVSSSFVGNDFVVNVEESLKIKPSVVLQWGDKGDGLTASLENAGIPVVGLKYGTQDDLKTWVNLLGKILGQEDRANNLLTWQDEKLREIQNLTANLSETEKPKVLYLYSPDTLRTTGSGTYNNEYLGWTGAVNLASGTKDFNDLTMEQIIAWDPEIVYVGNFGKSSAKDILNNSIPGQKWQSVKAVTNRRVYDVPLGSYRWDPPSQESPFMWMWLVSVQHPDLADFDLKAEMGNFYRKFFKYDLTEEDYKQILKCGSEANGKLAMCK